MALADFRTIAGYKLQDTASKVSTAQLNAALLEAVKRYSRIRPRERVQTLTGNGVLFTHALATDYEERFSRILAIENPADEQDPVYLDESDFQLYRDPADGVLKLRFVDQVLVLNEKAYVSYTARHSVIDGADRPAAAPPVALAGLGAGNVTAGAHTYSQTYVTAAGETEESAASASITTSAGNGQALVGVVASSNVAVTGIKLYRTVAAGAQRKLLATLANTTVIYVDNLADGTLGVNAPTTNTTGGADTVPVPDRDAVATLGAAICARELAAYYSQTTDATLAADAVTYRTKNQEYLAIAKALEGDYCRHLGISEENMVMAASAVGDLDVDLEGGTDRFYHPRRDR